VLLRALKFDLLLKEANPLPPQRASVLKKCTLELQKEPLQPEELELLNLGLNFSVTPTAIPFMDFTCPFESAATFLEAKGQDEDANLLRQNTCGILKNAKAPKSNLSFRRRQALYKLTKKKNISVAPFDKGKGFVVLDTEDLKNKAYKEMDNVTFNGKDITKKLERNICTAIDKLYSEDKISEKQKKELKPSDSIAPASWPAIKAHKRDKNYPVRNVVSHIGCPQEGLSKLLIPILQPLIHNDPYQNAKMQPKSPTSSRKRL
jgi:hypothetical protein